MLRDEAHRAAGGVACANDPVVIAQTFAGFRPDLDLRDAFIFAIAGNIDDSSMRLAFRERARGSAARSVFRALDHRGSAAFAAARESAFHRHARVSDFLSRLTVISRRAAASEVDRVELARPFSVR